MSFLHHPDPRAVLRAVLDRLAAAAPSGVVAFDLDSTLLDNRPRQAAIVRDFARQAGVEALAAFDASHLHTGFDTREALARAGLSPEDVERWMPALRRHWSERFFTSDACLADVPVAGAPELVRRAHATGGRLVYLTARPERMRPGTETVLARFGFPALDARVSLWMKPDDPSIGDEAFKRGAHARLADLGPVVAAFDNEPGHVNDFRASFPDATVVLVATGHSGRVGTLADGIAVVPDLRLDL